MTSLKSDKSKLLVSTYQCYLEANEPVRSPAPQSRGGATRGEPHPNRALKRHLSYLFFLSLLFADLTLNQRIFTTS